ncbi:DUF2254 domain-containing protein [Ekhidna sp.]|uniref:DUF2254 domain-containing protein n=1 Tax=Ekhidna sp. TaxID=2608089 RepID=UPI003B59C4D3
MKTKLLYFKEVLQASFWFLPLLLVIVAIGLAIGFVYLDSIIQYSPDNGLKYFFAGGVDSARSILSTIAGAMLGVASTVFSITLVALTLATSQFGSRLLRNFMHDRLNQFVLGTYIATFIYCLLVLRTVKSTAEVEFVPNISVLFAMFLALANIFLLIIFIHHIAMSIQADKVVSDISKRLHRDIHSLFPEELGKENDDDKKPLIDKIKKVLPTQSTVTCRSTGYLQAVDEDGLMALARTHNLLIFLDNNPGDFIIEKQVLLKVYAEKECEYDLTEKLQSVFLFGEARTPIQDAEFAVHQMVEIASRALSPGINDPYTAITCIDKLTGIMCKLATVEFPSAYRFDRDGHLRVVVKPVTFGGVMDAAYNQIRQFGAKVPSVLIRMMESFTYIHSFVQTDDQRKALQKHVKMVLETAEASQMNVSDLEDLSRRFEEIDI